MCMKFLKKLFGISGRQGAGEQSAAVIGSDELDDTSINWIGVDSLSSTMFDDAPDQVAAERRPHRASRRVAAGQDRDGGYNPYDTGSLKRS